ncbi:hypothetical protein K3495_g9063 [Podosphaera aphanis]|nr:hypothetical protein K3495_g9063 [Podosphaera aphanis]
MRAEAKLRTQWKKADRELVNQRLATKLRDISGIESQPLTREDIDHGVAKITAAIQLTAEETIPKAKQSQFTKQYCTKVCSRLVNIARRARRK